jgi:hypothetical protein
LLFYLYFFLTRVYLFIPVRTPRPPLHRWIFDGRVQRQWLFRSLFVDEQGGMGEWMKGMMEKTLPHTL